MQAGLLGFQCGDALRQAVEFALLLERQFHRPRRGAAGGRFVAGWRTRAFRPGLLPRLGLARVLHPQPVLVAAGIFAPAPVALGRDHLGHHVVQERAIVADQEQRAVVAGEQFLEQVQRLDVQVVGRLVQHHHVGRSREQAGEQQAVALAA